MIAFYIEVAAPSAEALKAALATLGGRATIKQGGSLGYELHSYDLWRDAQGLAYELSAAGFAAAVERRES